MVSSGLTNPGFEDWTRNKMKMLKNGFLKNLIPCYDTLAWVSNKFLAIILFPGVNEEDGSEKYDA